MSGELNVPGSVLHAISPLRFRVLDEHGTDVAALLANPEWSATLAGSTLTIPEAQASDFRAHLLRCLPRVAGNRYMEDYVRAWLLQRALHFEVEAVFRSTERTPQARGLLEVTRGFAHEGASWSPGPVPSYRHREHMGKTYTPVAHAVNATLYATSLAAAAGEDNREVLQGVALAAVFADVGIVEASDAACVERAVDLLRRASVSSVAAVVGVLARRCRWDGRGVPGIGGSVIPFEARCTAIACDYDLLTVSGEHGGALSPNDALTQMAQAVGRYDPALLRTFIRLLGGVASDDAESVERGGSSKHPERVREMLRALRIA